MVSVFFELFTGPGKSVVMDHAGNCYAESWELSAALGFPKYKTIIGVVFQGASLGWYDHPADVGYPFPFRDVAGPLATELAGSFKNNTPEDLDYVA